MAKAWVGRYLSESGFSRLKDFQDSSGGRVFGAAGVCLYSDWRDFLVMAKMWIAGGFVRIRIFGIKGFFRILAAGVSSYVGCLCIIRLAGFAVVAKARIGRSEILQIL